MNKHIKRMLNGMVITIATSTLMVGVSLVADKYPKVFWSILLVGISLFLCYVIGFYYEENEKYGGIGGMKNDKEKQ